jgi:CheY-like chemotaxis protein
LKKILIVEDDPTLLYIFELLLADLGHQLILTRTAPRLEDVVLMMPDLVLLDHHLSGSLGGDLCAAIKASPLTGGIRVVLCSADNFLEQLARQHKADGFIIKPFDIADLERQVRKFL